MKGCGRGWSEPLATGRWNRFLQRMREPATKMIWVAVANVTAIIVLLLALFL